jgi:hypothetical protein
VGWLEHRDLPAFLQGLDILFSFAVPGFRSQQWKRQQCSSRSSTAIGIPDVVADGRPALCHHAIRGVGQGDARWSRSPPGR